MKGKEIRKFLPDGAGQRGAAAEDSRERERERWEGSGKVDDDEDDDDYRGRRRAYRRRVAYQMCHRGGLIISMDVKRFKADKNRTF